MNAARMANDLDMKLLEQLNQDYLTSGRDSNVKRYGEILAEDFQSTNPDGSFVDRAGFLARIAKQGPVAKLEAHDVLIRVLGDVALIHARTTWQRADGQAASGRYTDIWARRKGQWLAVAAHYSVNK